MVDNQQSPDKNSPNKQKKKDAKEDVKEDVKDESKDVKIVKDKCDEESPEFRQGFEEEKEVMKDYYSEHSAGKDEVNMDVQTTPPAPTLTPGNHCKIGREPSAYFRVKT